MKHINKMWNNGLINPIINLSSIEKNVNENIVTDNMKLNSDT